MRMRWFAWRERSKFLRDRVITLSVNPLSQRDDESQLIMDDLVHTEPPALWDCEVMVSDCLWPRILADLPRSDRKFWQSRLSDDEMPTRGAEPAMSAAQRKASSRSDGRLRTLWVVHRQTGVGPDRDRLRRAIDICIADGEDSALAASHLLDGRGLDDLKREQESDDEVRFRFLRIANRFLPVIDPERVRALDLLPDRHRLPIDGVFFQKCSVEDRAIENGCALADGRGLLRPALAALRTLQVACGATGSPKGITMLEDCADRATRPSRFLIRRIIINGEFLHEVASQYRLAEDEARELLLRALQDTLKA